MYADDLLLMSGSIVNLQCMINICTEYGLIRSITFDHVKSNCLAIYPHSSHLPVFSFNINGVNLLWMTKIPYLGIYITSDCKNSFDVSECITKFYGSVHAITALICNNNELVALEILVKQC